MARRRRKQAPPPLPLIKGEIWEIGRRGLTVHVDDLARQDETPEILLAIQTGEAGGVVSAAPITSSAPARALSDFALQAMREPLLGQPRQPEVIRVASQAEAEILAVMLATTGIALEITSQLDMLNAVHQHLGATLDGLTHDYQTQATQAGAPLSAAGLRAFFRTARTFYRQEMWLAYDDDVMFDIALQPADGPARTLYGIMMGSMGEEFGLALFRTLTDLERFYELSVEHLGALPGFPEDDADQADPVQQQHAAEMTAQLLQVSSISLTYTSQQDVPPPLVQEAQRLKLPLANTSAFPLLMRTGQGVMQVAAATDLADMCAALRALLDWEKQLDKMDIEDEIDYTITSKLKAVEDFLPALTVQTTLRDNPYAPEDSDDLSSSEFETLFETLFTEPPRRKSPKTSVQASAGKTPQTVDKGTGANRIYTLNVSLAGGPITDAYANQEISRQIDMRGNQTLHELHKAIFDAFERWEHHLYEFNLGAGPADRSQLYFYHGGWDDGDEEEGDPEITTIDALDLSKGRRFGYTFDMGDTWEHVIEVMAVTEGPGKGRYPQVTKKVGAAPPQYPEDNDEIE